MDKERSLWGKKGLLMDALIAKLTNKLGEWQPQIAQEVRGGIAELIEWADHDSLELMRSRAVEQEEVDILHVSETR